MESANYAQKREDMPVSFKSAVWENFGFQVNCVSDGGRAVNWIRTVHLLYSTAVGDGQGNTNMLVAVFILLLLSCADCL